MHAPHWPWSQPFFALVTPSRSRSASSSVVRVSTFSRCVVPSTRSVISASTPAPRLPRAIGNAATGRHKVMLFAKLNRGYSAFLRASADCRETAPGPGQPRLEVRSRDGLRAVEQHPVSTVHMVRTLRRSCSTRRPPTTSGRRCCGPPRPARCRPCRSTWPICRSRRPRETVVDGHGRPAAPRRAHRRSSVRPWPG